MISPELTERMAVCHASPWRPLRDGSPRPALYVMLSSEEVHDLVTTGSYSLPADIIPESVQRWRQLQDAADQENKPLTAQALREAAHV